MSAAINFCVENGRFHKNQIVLVIKKCQFVSSYFRSNTVNLLFTHSSYYFDLHPTHRNTILPVGWIQEHHVGLSLWLKCVEMLLNEPCVSVVLSIVNEELTDPQDPHKLQKLLSAASWKPLNSSWSSVYREKKTNSSLEVKGPEAATGAAIGHKTHRRPSEERREGKSVSKMSVHD